VALYKCSDAYSRKASDINCIAHNNINTFQLQNFLVNTHILEIVLLLLLKEARPVCVSFNSWCVFNVDAMYYVVDLKCWRNTETHQWLH
jgi:hypothetical protein